MAASEANETKFDKVFRQVQGLLAKAESTDSEAEAEAFNEKAQELMLKYAIDEAEVRKAANARGAESSKPVVEMFEFSTSDANIPGKRNLLNAVAQANRVRVIYVTANKRVKARHVYVVGFESDVAFTKMLYASLLMQSMTAAGRAFKAQGRTSGRKAFTTHFMIGFGNEVHARMQKTVAKTAETALVFVDDKKVVDDAFTTAFPETRKIRARTSAFDARAHGAGRTAGENADISGGRNNLGGKAPRQLG